MLIGPARRTADTSTELTAAGKCMLSPNCPLGKERSTQLRVDKGSIPHQHFMAFCWKLWAMDHPSTPAGAFSSCRAQPPTVHRYYSILLTSHTESQSSICAGCSAPRGTP